MTSASVAVLALCMMMGVGAGATAKQPAKNAGGAPQQAPPQASTSKGASSAERYSVRVSGGAAKANGRQPTRMIKLPRPSSQAKIAPIQPGPNSRRYEFLYSKPFPSNARYELQPLYEEYSHEYNNIAAMRGYWAIQTGSNLLGAAGGAKSLTLPATRKNPQVSVRSSTDGTEEPPGTEMQDALNRLETLADRIRPLEKKYGITETQSPLKRNFNEPWMGKKASKKSPIKESPQRYNVNKSGGTVKLNGRQPTPKAKTLTVASFGPARRNDADIRRKAYEAALQAASDRLVAFRKAKYRESEAVTAEGDAACAASEANPFSWMRCLHPYLDRKNAIGTEIKVAEDRFNAEAAQLKNSWQP